MHLSNSYFRCNKSYKTCPVKGTITISFLFKKELFLKFVTLKTEITPCFEAVMDTVYAVIHVEYVFIAHILIYILHKYWMRNSISPFHDVCNCL